MVTVDVLLKRRCDNTTYTRLIPAGNEVAPDRGHPGRMVRAAVPGGSGEVLVRG